MPTDHRTRFRTGVAAVAIATALTVTACGGGEKDDDADAAADRGEVPTAVEPGAGSATVTTAPDDAAAGGTAAAGDDDLCAALTRFALRPADAGGNGLGVLAQDLVGVDAPPELAGAVAVLTQPDITDDSLTDPGVSTALDQVAAYADTACPPPAPPGGP